jgi:hypothetical protein
MAEPDTETYRFTDELSPADERASVVLRRGLTPNGERLVVRSESGESIELDALALESLTWQTPEDIERIVREDGRFEADRDLATVGDGDDAVGDPFTVSNEYTRVEIAKFVVDGDEYARIVSLKLDYDIVLDPTLLSVIAAQPMETFSEFLETPYGP